MKGAFLCSKKLDDDPMSDALTQTLRTYVQEHPHTRVCVLLFPEHTVTQIRRCVAHASLATETPIDLLTCIEANRMQERQTRPNQAMPEHSHEKGNTDEQ